MKFLIDRLFPLIRTYGTTRPYSARNIAHLASRDVLRSTSGRLSLVSDDSTSDSFLPLSGFNVNTARPSDDDKLVDVGELDLKGESVPVVDIGTFKNYLMVPPLGLRRFFSSELVKIDENKEILYKQYVPGSLVAHNYPLTVLPVRHSRRIHPDIFVKTFVEDDRNYKVTADNRKIRLSLSPGLKIHDSYPLLHKVCGSPSLLFIFSGDLPNCQYNSVQKWLSYPHSTTNRIKISVVRSSAAIQHLLATNMPTSTNTNVYRPTNSAGHLNVLNSPCSRLLSWAYGRYLETLARTIVEESRFMSVTRRLSTESIVALHQYRKQLPSVILVDRNGYIRWHAVGYPTLEAVTILNDSVAKVLNEA
ncbi:conserved hypothetical protein [Theileria orientalis strain Shintoku]|uniref:Uncharacterized protein n=1 Tax=Theileria orientalis strain Shintoku TaxID=869250 RepID=J4C8U1_THEOR|nr:conserved hypothetical protein [Theileria orientalis strain Shintoku]BAM41378.1 conserved hypothetical protein [Theileria orientalis strain Shintoku]|eukprot:XP_009691679.1 conserved hypothetical protein [Theileria orientalis strain Shintoku]